MSRADDPPSQTVARSSLHPACQDDNWWNLHLLQRIRNYYGNLWPVTWFFVSIWLELFCVMYVDKPIAQIHPKRKHAFEGVVEFLTNRGESAFWIVASVLVGVIGVRLRKPMIWGPATSVWTSIVIGGLITNGGKALFGRTRPSAWVLNGEPYGLYPFTFDWDYQSFPSGHSTTVGALAVALAFTFHATRHARWMTPVVIALSLLVALTRVLNNAHHVSDVIAGYSVGGLTAWTIARYGPIKRRRFAHWVNPDTGEADETLSEVVNEIKAAKPPAPSNVPHDSNS